MNAGTASGDLGDSREQPDDVEVDRWIRLGEAAEHVVADVARRTGRTWPPEPSP